VLRKRKQIKKEKPKSICIFDQWTWKLLQDMIYDTHATGLPQRRNPKVTKIKMVRASPARNIPKRRKQILRNTKILSKRS
jgi:hypothetical protein